MDMRHVNIPDLKALLKYLSHHGWTICQDEKIIYARSPIGDVVFLSAYDAASIRRIWMSRDNIWLYDLPATLNTWSRVSELLEKAPRSTCALFILRSEDIQHNVVRKITVKSRFG